MLQAEMQEGEVLQAEALLRHGLLVVPGHRLCATGLLRPGDVLLRAAELLHRFDLLCRPRRNLLLGVDLLLSSGGHLLLGSGGHLLCTRSDLLHGPGKLLRSAVGLMTAI